MGSSVYVKEHLTVGPWGGRGGRQWDDGVQASVREIIISYGSGIDSITFQYENKQGEQFWSQKHGGNGGDHTAMVMLNHPDEYLLAMRGFYGPIFGEHGPVCVRALTFVSNVRTYGPFGVEEGHSFTFQMVGGGQILGFYGKDGGKDGGFLDSIGAYVKHICPHNPPSAKNGCSVTEGNRADKFDVLTIKVPEETTQRKENKSLVKIAYGPWGGNGGTVFDDGNLYNGIKQISLARDGNGIVWVRVLYDVNGKSVWGSRHGGTCNGSIDMVALDYPSETLTSISGSYGSYLCGPTVIRSLTFHTTKGIYGPFGENSGERFCSTTLKDGAIIGIHGRSKGLFLDAIGVHVHAES